jgi:hypothetical protein
MQANIELYNRFLKSMPDFGELITQFEEEPDSLTSFIKSVGAYMRFF